MTVSKALEEVGRHYIPGVAKYYAALTPDPWQKAHDHLEAAMLMSDPDLISHRAQQFVIRCRELIDRFQKEGTMQGGVSSADAFYMNDEKRVREWQSVKYKTCIQCGTKENLTLMPSKDDPIRVNVICRPCKEARAA